MKRKLCLLLVLPVLTLLLSAGAWADTEAYPASQSEKYTPTLTVSQSADELYFGTSPSIIAHLSDFGTDAPSIVYYINGYAYTREVDDNGDAFLTVNLNPGEYTVGVHTVDTPTCNGVEADDYTFTILKNHAVISLSSSGTALKAHITAYGALTTTGISGVDMSFLINGKTYTRTTDSSGDASLDINLEPGTYIATVKVIDSLRLYEAEETCTVYIQQKGGNIFVKYTPTIHAADTLGEDITLLNLEPGSSQTLLPYASTGTEKINPASTGAPVFTYTTSNAAVASVSDAGVVTCNGLGSADITISAAATSAYNASKPCTVKVQGKRQPTLTVSQSASTLYYGSSPVLTAHISNYGDTDPLVSFYFVDSDTEGVYSSEGGVSSMSPNLKPGTYTVRVFSHETEDALPSNTAEYTFTIAKGIPVIDLTASGSSLVAHVYPFGGSYSPGLTGMSACIEINGMSYTKSTDTTGCVSQQIYLISGSYAVTVTVPETDDYAGAEASCTVISAGDSQPIHISDTILPRVQTTHVENNGEAVTSLVLYTGQSITL